MSSSSPVPLKNTHLSSLTQVAALVVRVRGAVKSTVLPVPLIDPTHTHTLTGFFLHPSALSYAYTTATFYRLSLSVSVAVTYLCGRTCGYFKRGHRQALFRFWVHLCFLKLIDWFKSSKPQRLSQD